MTVLPLSGYISDTRTKGEMKTALEAVRDCIEELVGGGAENDVTLSSDAFTYAVKKGVYVVNAEAGVTDSLKWITTAATTKDGATALIRAASGDTITVVDGAGGADQILTRSGSDVVLADSGQFMLVKYLDSGSCWEEVFNTADIQVIEELLGAAAEEALTITGGAVVPSSAIASIETEGGAAADNLDNITTTYMDEGRLFLFRCVNAGHVVTVRDSQGGAGQIVTRDSTDLVMDDVFKFLLVRRIGTDWYEVARFGFVWEASDGGTGNGSITTTAGHVPYFDGTKMTTLGPTASKTVMFNSAGNAIEAGDPFGFESSAQTITAGGLLTLAHGLSYTPTRFQYSLKCIDAGGEAGFAQNDITGGAPLCYTAGTQGAPLAMYADGTNVYVRFNNYGAAGLFYAPNKGTGAGTALTNAKWNLLVKAW